MAEGTMTHLALFNSVFNASTIESLREEERLIASLIFENAREVVTSISAVDGNSSDDDENDAEFTNKFELTRRNLLDIINAFNELEDARNSFKKHASKLVPLRKNTISSLREIADCINTDRENCNIAIITSSTFGVFGGLALGATLVFPPAAVALGAFGAVASLAGGATVFGASATQVSLLHKQMNKAKKILEKDTKQFEPLAKWFTRSQNLIDLLNKVIGFDVIHEIFKGLIKFKSDVSDLFSLRNKTIHSILKKIIKHTIDKVAPNRSGTACSTFELLIPVVLAFIFVMILFRKSNSLLFDCVVITHHTALGLLRLLDLGSDLGMLIYSAAAKAGVATTEVCSKATAKLIARGALAGIGVALDLTNLVYASIDYHKGSVSEQAVHLKALADRLENELKVIEAVNRALF